MSRYFRDAARRVMAANAAGSKYYSGNPTHTNADMPSTFTRPAFAPGALAMGADGNTPQDRNYWAERLASRAKGATPYIYPKPPPVINPQAWNADDPRYQPAWMQRESGDAVVLAGYAHDAILRRPRDAGGAVVPVAWEDPIYKRVPVDSLGENAFATYNDLPQWQKDVWSAVAESLGGGSRSGSSTYAKFFSASGARAAEGENWTAWDLLMENIDAGEIDPGVLAGNRYESGSSGGGGSYGGGGGFGGGGGAGQINLMNEEDARAVVNSLASQMLGRTVNEKEFQQYYKSILSLQKANPSTVTVDEAGNTVVQDPMGVEGMRFNLEEQMRNTEDFVTNTVGTQAMGLLEKYIQSRRIGG